MVETSDRQYAVLQGDDTGMKVGLAFFDHEGRKRCAITAKRVENPLSLYNSTSTLCSERVECEGVLMVNIEGKFVPIEQDEPFEEGKGHWQGETASPALSQRESIHVDHHRARQATLCCCEHRRTHQKESSACAAGEVSTYPRKVGQ